MFYFVTVFGYWLQGIGIDNKEACNRFSKYMKDNPEAYGIQQITFMGLFLIGLSFMFFLLHGLDWLSFQFNIATPHDSLVHQANIPITTFIMDGVIQVIGYALIMTRGILVKTIFRKKIRNQNLRKLKGSDGS